MKNKKPMTNAEINKVITKEEVLQNKLEIKLNYLYEKIFSVAIYKKIIIGLLQSKIPIFKE